MKKKENWMIIGAAVIAYGKPGVITAMLENTIDNVQYVYYMDVKLDGQKGSGRYHPGDVSLPVNGEEKTLYLVNETDFYKLERKEQFGKEMLITFKFPGMSTFEKHDYDWYITVALEKADQVRADRHLLTRDLLLQYRWAIREGYQHQLDPNLNKQFAYPRNKNTVQGIEGYIALISKKSQAEMAGFEEALS